MNFTVTDISNSILSMGPPELTGSANSGIVGSGSTDPLFEERLGRILNQGRPVEYTSLPAGDDDLTAEQEEAVLNFLNQKLEGKTGRAFLTELRNIFLMLSKGNLGNVSIDATGLEAMKKALLKAGFDADELDALMARLTEESEQATVTLDTLFDQLLDVPMDQLDAAETEPDHFLETSSLPALETILNDLGIPADQVREILARADKGEKGISLDTVIDQLRQLQKQSFYTQNPYQSSMNEDTLLRLLNQLGIENGRLKNGGLTLHDLVGEFEKLLDQSVSKLLSEANASSGSSLLSKEQTSSSSNLFSKENAFASSTASNEKQSDLLNDLFKGLKLLSASKDKNGFEFSRDQIKNHFKNELLASEAAGLNSTGSHLTGLNSKGLFATQNDKKISKDQLLKEGLKEMGRSLDGNKSGQTPGMKGALLENKEFINQLKNRLTGLTDESHSSLSETKSSDPQAGQTVSKSRGAAKTLPAFVTQQVSKSIVKAVNQGESTLRINLKPPELGRLMLTIDNSGNSMRVNVVAETAAARDVLLSNANELRTVLSNSGVHLERFDVDMNSDFRQSMADAKNQAGNFNKRNRNKEDQESDPLANTASNESATLTDMIESGESLHFVA